MKRIIKTLLLVMFAVPILNACSREPARKVIEYDEEVRLHDGSMIWVRITRHYRRVGALGQGSAYKPTITEISWDTGIPDVGRQSVFFELVYLIDTHKGGWHLAGESYHHDNPKELDNGAVNCLSVGNSVKKSYIHKDGTKLSNRHCMVFLNTKGEFINKDQYGLENSNHFFNNVLPDSYHRQLNELRFIDGSRLTWQEKVNDPMKHTYFSKPYTLLEIKK